MWCESRAITPWLGREPIQSVAVGFSRTSSLARGLFQRAEPTLQRHFAFSFGQGIKDALPEAGVAPQSIALVRRLPRAALLGQCATGGAGAHHPEDAGEHGAMVVTRSPPRRLLRREERLDEVPLVVGELHGRHGGWQRSADERPGALALRSRSVAAGGDRLVRPAAP